MTERNQRMPRRVGDRMHCCFIGCDWSAGFLVRPKRPLTYEDYTHACGDHVEDLKESQDDVVEPL